MFVSGSSRLARCLRQPFGSDHCERNVKGIGTQSKPGLAVRLLGGTDRSVQPDSLSTAINTCAEIKLVIVTPGSCIVVTSSVEVCVINFDKHVPGYLRNIGVFAIGVAELGETYNLEKKSPIAWASQR